MVAAESKADNMLLVSLQEKTEAVTTKRRKYEAKKPCPICGGKYKRVSAHITRSHQPTDVMTSYNEAARVS